MKGFAGTGKLIRLALRLDRIKLPLWIVGIVGTVAASASALEDFYSTVEQQISYASTAAPSVVSRVMGGPIDGVSLGSIAMVELFYFTAIMVAFMSTLTVVRHTRKTEETGAAELIQSGSVGRYASLTAAMLVAAGANLVVFLLTTMLLSQTEGLSGAGAAGFGLALALTGIAFAGIAAIGAQLSETGRGANSIAAAAIGISFIVRAIGDGLATVSPDKLSAEAHWASWLSPLGWGYQTKPFTAQNWWILILLAAFMVLAIGISFLLLSRRDVGLGIIPARTGRSAAKASLLTPLGGAWRLQRGVFIGWLIGFITFGVLIGSMAKEFANFFTDNEEALQALEAFGGAGASMTDVFFSAMFSVLGILAAGYSLQALLKIRSEETTGHLEHLLGTALSRSKWLLSHVFIVAIGATALLLIGALVAGSTYAVIANVATSEIFRLIGASLVQLPAVLMFVGGVLLLFGLFPRIVTGVAWGFFAGTFLVLQLGALLNLPNWVTNISPFSHLPSAPAQSVNLQPLIILIAIVLVFSAMGVYGFKSRDLTNDS